MKKSSDCLKNNIQQLVYYKRHTFKKPRKVEIKTLKATQGK